MVCFGPIWNIWTNLGNSKGLFEKIEKLQMFCISLVYLLLYVTYMQNFKKMHACEAAAGAKLG